MVGKVHNFVAFILFADFMIFATTLLANEDTHISD